MEINCFSVTFWFNIYKKHNEILEVFQKELKDEYKAFNVFNYTNNLIAPIIKGINSEKKTNMVFSQINLQYNMDNVSLKDLDDFKLKTQKLFDILTANNIEVAHTSVYINGEYKDDNALENISKNTISEGFKTSDLVDISLKLGKKHEDLFYKIAVILNKKQVKLPQKLDENNEQVPLPLISWNGALVEKEIIEFSYEINDKYSFDFTKNYHTTEFYLNKMLYILMQDFENDIESVLKEGKF